MSKLSHFERVKIGAATCDAAIEAWCEISGEPRNSPVSDEFLQHFAAYMSGAAGMAAQLGQEPLATMLENGAVAMVKHFASLDVKEKISELEKIQSEADATG